MQEIMLEQWDFLGYFHLFPRNIFAGNLLCYFSTFFPYKPFQGNYFVTLFPCKQTFPGKLLCQSIFLNSIKFKLIKTTQENFWYEWGLNPQPSDL
jgi:hypothetical protein